MTSTSSSIIRISISWWIKSSFPHEGAYSRYLAVCMSSTKASLSANLLWLGRVSSVGNLTPRISKGCKTLHSGPNSSGRPSTTRGSNGSLSSEFSSSPECSSTCPSDICCTHVLGLQVAVAVGLGGDPLGR